MIVYHGSSVEVQNPKIIYSKAFLDFGKGFYVTSFKTQAEKWAMRKAIRQGKHSFVNVYELQDNLQEYKVLSFENENEKWLDFVCECRTGSDTNHDYHIIVGNVANDDVFKTIDMYIRGMWTREKALEELRYYKMNDQICITNQNVLNSVLKFQKSYQVVSLNDR